MKTKDVPLIEGRSTRVTKNLIVDTKEKLVNLLQKKKDLFAYSSSDMPGVDLKIIQHSLNVDLNARPIKQNKPNNLSFKRAFIKESVAKLKEAGVVREVAYLEWLSNAVVVTR